MVWEHRSDNGMITNGIAKNQQNDNLDSTYVKSATSSYENVEKKSMILIQID